jgi:hypothetical protein
MSIRLHAFLKCDSRETFGGAEFGVQQGEQRCAEIRLKVSGGGAIRRMLPTLPIQVVDGKLLVADMFIGSVGGKRGSTL